MALITKRFQITGMSCDSCQNRIQRALAVLPGVERASVSWRRGIAEVAFDPNRTGEAQIAAAITSLGYALQEGQDFLRTLSLSVIILALYVLLERLGLLNLLVPGRLAEGGMGYGMLFAVGLLTSVHCVAMCGGIGLSQCLPGGGERGSAWRPALFYNAGRVVSYTAAGFVLGLAGMLAGGGASTGVPVLLQGLLKLAAGLLMAVMGLNMLNIFPWLRRLSPRLPRFFSTGSAHRPFAVGLLNGLMPCGPLQSMQILALATGSPLRGALSMLIFSLGTVPLMLGLGTLVTALGRRFSRAVTSVGAVLVTVLGLAMLAQGGSLSGMLLPNRLLLVVAGAFVVGIAASIPFKRRLGRVLCAALVLTLGAGMLLRAESPQPGEGSVRIVNGVQRVESTLQPGSYPTITVRAGMPVEWNIAAPAGSINGCNYRMFIPEYGVDLSFAEGDNLIRFTPGERGEFAYSCWMGMIRGGIIVT